LPNHQSQRSRPVKGSNIAEPPRPARQPGNREPARHQPLAHRAAAAADVAGPAHQFRHQDQCQGWDLCRADDRTSRRDWRPHVQIDSARLAAGPITWVTARRLSSYGPALVTG